MRKTITIKFETWQELLKIKAELGKRSLDDVIRELIKAWKEPSKSKRVKSSYISGSKL